MKTLLVADFDNTFIDDNSDIRIKNLLPNATLPDSIDCLRKVKDGWMNYMREIFRFLHEKGITADDYYRCLTDMPLMHGMKDLLNAVNSAEDKYEVILLSDSNTVFINFCLQVNGLSHCVRSVFTNQSSFDDNGCLTIQGFQQQDTCNLCTRNICKGSILLEYIQERCNEGQSFDRTVYIGDGGNDVCPALKLGADDLIFARNAYPMAKKLNRLANEDSQKIKARLYLWDSAYDIKNILFPE